MCGRLTDRWICHPCLSSRGQSMLVITSKEQTMVVGIDCVRRARQDCKRGWHGCHRWRELGKYSVARIRSAIVAPKSHFVAENSDRCEPHDATQRTRQSPELDRASMQSNAFRRW